MTLTVWEKDGMITEEFLGISNNALCLSKSGNLYFTTDGVVIVNPKEVK